MYKSFPHSCPRGKLSPGFILIQLEASLFLEETGRLQFASICKFMHAYGTEIYLPSDLLLLCLFVESPETYCLLYDSISHNSHLPQDNASVQKKKSPYFLSPTMTNAEVLNNQVLRTAQIAVLNTYISFSNFSASENISIHGLLTLS